MGKAADHLGSKKLSVLKLRVTCGCYISGYMGRYCREKSADINNEGQNGLFFLAI